MNFPEDEIRYVDLPDILDTFVDSIGISTLIEGVVRVELCATRLERSTGKTKTPNAIRYPVCRLALSPSATLKLHEQLGLMIKGLVESGVLKKAEPPDITKH